VRHSVRPGYLGKEQDAAVMFDLIQRDRSQLDLGLHWPGRVKTVQDDLVSSTRYYENLIRNGSSCHLSLFPFDVRIERQE